MHGRECLSAERAEMAPDPFSEMKIFPAGDMGHATGTYAGYVQVACKIMCLVVANKQVWADAPKLQQQAGSTEYSCIDHRSLGKEGQSDELHSHV